ncbi:MAG: repeat containing protein [Verrucomicrobiales bacterium]|nr:repeat containing protein [Verrucomicrobiales bacterium]
MNKQLRHMVLASCALLTLAANVRSQPLVIRTLAGQPNPGIADGAGSNAQFNGPSSIAVDDAWNVYITDSQNGTIRKISTNNVVSTFAGSAGSFGSLDGTGNQARFYGPQGIAVDSAGILFVADTANATIRKITPEGAVSTFAGAAGSLNSFDGVGTNANFFQPEGIAVDKGGNVYVADAWNHTIRKITPLGVVSTLAGLAGSCGSMDGTNSKARFDRPAGIAVDGATNLFVTDSLNHTVRKITPSGRVTTIVGLPGVWGNADGTNGSARLFQPQGIVADNVGNLFVSDSGNQTIRKVSASGTNWVVSTVAGLGGSAGDANGTGDIARFYFPAGLAMNSAGYLLVADSGNNTIRNEGFELSSLYLLADGRFHFTLNGKSNLNYAVEASSNLIQWSVITNLSSHDGVLEFVDPTPQMENRFYRAVVSP